MLLQYLAEQHYRKSLLEALELHDELNPLLFNEDDLLKEDVREALLGTANAFIKELKENEIPINILDVWLVGSNASYNYSKTSDIDVHIIANIEEDKELLSLLYNYAKSNFNKDYNITVKGLPVEVYIEDVNSNAVTNGIYSLTSNEWVKFPQPIEVPDINIEESDLYQDLMREYEELRDKDVQKFIDRLYIIRKVSLSKDGEFGEGNLIFKKFRSEGLLDKLKDRRKEIISKELTLERYLKEEQGSEKAKINRQLKKELNKSLSDTKYDNIRPESTGFTVHHLNPHSKDDYVVFISHKYGAQVADALHRLFEINKKVPIHKLLKIPCFFRTQDNNIEMAEARRLLKENREQNFNVLKEVEEEKYFRLEIEGLGSLFRAADDILPSGYIEEGTPEYYFNGDLAQLELRLGKPPKINERKAKFAYKEKEFDQIQGIIKDIRDDLQEMGYKLKIIRVIPNKIIYEDDMQIAYI